MAIFNSYVSFYVYLLVFGLSLDGAKRKEEGQEIMRNRLLSSVMVAAIAVLITYFFSSFFYNFNYSFLYLFFMFLFISIAWFYFYPKLMK
jgi:uncharacterized membrane protein